MPSRRPRPARRPLLTSPFALTVVLVATAAAATAAPPAGAAAAVATPTGVTGPTAAGRWSPSSVSGRQVAESLARLAPPPAPAPPSARSADCYYSTWGDPRDTAQLDVQAYGASYSCPSAQWSFPVVTYDAWSSASLSSYFIALDTDASPATGCGGFEWVVAAGWSASAGALEAATLSTPGCDPAGWSEAGPAGVDRADLRSVRLSVANATLGTPASIRWYGRVTGPAEPGDDIPDTGYHEEAGFAGGGCPATRAEGRSYTVVPSALAPLALDVLQRSGVAAVRSHGAGVVSFAGDSLAAQAALTSAGISATVTADQARSYQAVPNDPAYPAQWALHAVRAPAAWDRSRGAGSVVVAVVDSGVDATHPDLAGKLVPGFDTTTGTTLAPGNTDPFGHGTAVAGVIAAATDNATGVASLGWETKVLPVKDGDLAPLRSATVAGIRHAADRGARVINVSSGNPCTDTNEAAAVAYAQSRGALVVAAAGNSATQGNRISYPAAHPGVLAVGATGFDGSRAFYSNVGDYVGLVAPGGSLDGDDRHDVLVLDPGGRTRSGAGTSYSAPMVSAAAALILAVRPGSGPAELTSLLTSTATDLGPPGRDPEYGSGLLNADAALAAAGAPASTPPPVAIPPPPAPAGYRLVAADGGIFAFGDARFFGSTGAIRLNQPIVGLAATPGGGRAGPGGGYWLVARDGGIFAFGDARFFGSTGAIRLNQPIVGMAATPGGGGYRMVAADGGIFAFGDARFFGSTGAIRLNQPIVGMAATSSGNGYWLVARDGGIFAFGDARFFGSTGAIRLNQPIVGMAATPSGNGYWLVAADGGIFAFGDARFFGSTGAIRLNQPIVGMAATSSGNGYWLVARDGGIFAFGDARFFGSTGAIRLNQPIVGMAATSSGNGYWLVARDGGIFAFGDARFFGSTGAIRLNQPIVGIA